MKNYTDIQQSKKLAEFLPAKSADIFPDNIPCWSIGALLDLFPYYKESPIFNITRGGYNDKGSYTRDWFVTLEDENSNIKYSEQAPELIDAVVNMIVKLKEKNLL